MDKQQKTILVILAIILTAVLTVLVIYIAKGREVVRGEFEAPKFDETAISGTPDIDESYNYREISVSEGFTFSMCGNLTLKDNGCVVYFTSPYKNDVWLLMKLYDEKGNLLGQSGLLRPGEYIEAIELSQSIKETIPIKIKILSYEPDTYLSMGSAEATLTLKVTE